MHRLLPLLLTVAVLLPAASAQQRLDRPAEQVAPEYASPVAPGYEHLLQRERPYTINPVTGSLSFTPAARVDIEHRATERRKTRLAEMARLPQSERTRPGGSEGIQRGGAIVFTVNSAYDNPDSVPGDGFCFTDFAECSLRAAIEEANAQPISQPVRIEFNITLGPLPVSSGVWTIPVNFDDGTGANSILPSVSHPEVTIDGLTQNGASCGNLTAGTKHTLKVVLDGSLLPGGSGLHGLVGGAREFEVQGLVVQNFVSGFGLFLGNFGSSGPLRAECNYVGTDVSGEDNQANLAGILAGIGPVTVRNNLLSGNLGEGVYVLGNAAHVQSNLIGTDADGLGPLGNGFFGVDVLGADVRVTDNIVSANSSHGIVLTGATRAALLENTVGLNRLRMSAGLGNNGFGILAHLASNDNDIGTPLDGNYVADHAFATGILVTSEGGDDNQVRGNVVGLDAAGNAAPNFNGIWVGNDSFLSEGSPNGTIVGRLGVGEAGNVVAGNTTYGIVLNEDEDTLVEANTVGLNLSSEIRGNGNAGIRAELNTDASIRQNVVGGNGSYGLYILNASDISINANKVGLDASDAIRANGNTGLYISSGSRAVRVTSNTLSGNSGAGIQLSGSASDVVIEGNRIGIAPGGAPRGNGLDGIYCRSATDVRIGGTEAGQPNTIAFNGQADPNSDGIFTEVGCESVSLFRNSIYDNVGLGIDHCFSSFPFCDDVTPNDVPESDGIANYPVLASVENDGTDATITLSFDGLPNRTYRIEFFRSSASDPSGHGEGALHLTSHPLLTNASGEGSFVISRLAEFFPVGSWITATATLLDPPPFPGYRLTSEFSAAVQVEAVSTGPDFDLTATNTSPLTVAPGGSIAFDYAITNNTASAATGNLWFVAERGGSTVAQGVIRSGTLPASTTLSGSYVQNVSASAPSGTYTYRLRIGQFPSPTVDEEIFTVTVTGSARPSGVEAWSLADLTSWTEEVAEETKAASRGETLPTEAALTGAYPNPFNRHSTVAFALPEAQRVRLAVYDVLGREVVVLVNSEAEAGRHEAVLDGSGLPSGVYVVRLVTEDRTETQRVTLVR